MPRYYANRADRKLEGLIKRNERLLSEEPTPKNIERSDKAGEELSEYALKGATKKQADKYAEISGTFKDPSDLSDYARKIVAENRRKGRR